MPKGTLQLFSLSHDTERRRNNARQKSNLFLCMGEVGIDGFHSYIGDDAEGLAVDGGEVIVDGVPCRSKRTGFTLWVMRYYVCCRDASFLVHWDMVIGDVISCVHGEIPAISSSVGSVPHSFHHTWGKLLRRTLLIELGTLSAHHVEEYAEVGDIVRLLLVCSPIL